MVMRETIVVTVAGIVIGLALAVGLAGLIAALLYGISPQDPITIISVIALLFTVSASAAYLPARRASRIDPMSALRHE